MPSLQNSTPITFQETLKKMPVILIPIGAMEWHDEHLPIGFDYLKIEALCNLIAENIECFVSPPISFGYAFNFSKDIERGPVTFCPEYDSLSDYVFSLAKGFVDKGFKVIYFLSGHYERIQIYMLKVLTRRIEHYALEKGLIVKCFAHHEPDFTIRKGISHNSKEDYLRPNAGLDYFNGDHAGFYETSLGLYLLPHLVRMDKYRPQYNDPARGGLPSADWGRKWVSMIVAKASKEILMAVEGKNCDYSESD